MGGGVVIETDHTPTSLTEKLPPPIIMTGFVLVDKSSTRGNIEGVAHDSIKNFQDRSDRKET
jgi:hypothetical protein